MTLIFGGLELARAVSLKQALDRGAFEGARYLATHADLAGATTVAKNAVGNAILGGDPAKATVTSDWAPGVTGYGDTLLPDRELCHDRAAAAGFQHRADAQCTPLHGLRGLAMRLWHDRRGNAALGWMAALLLILCVGAMYDVYAAYHYRTWGYQVAGEAARYAVLQGSGLDYASGDPGLARRRGQQRRRRLSEEPPGRAGHHDYAFQTHVVVDPHGGSVAGFPPVAYASLDGRPMTLSGPGVGVYLEFSFPNRLA